MLRAGPLLFLAAAPLALAAPVPRETQDEKLRRLYGTPEDPDKLCTFALEGNRLRLTAAKGLRGLNPSRGLVNAPRTLKPVTGDFVATLRVVEDAPATGTDRDSEAYTPSGGGGLLLWVDADNHLRLSRSQWVGGGGSPTTYNLRGAVGGNELGHVHNLNTLDTKPITFRLTRTRGTLSSAYRHDGGAWQSFKDVEVDLPQTVKIGVYVAHNFDKPLDVVFEPLSVKPPEKKE